MQILAPNKLIEDNLIGKIIKDKKYITTGDKDLIILASLKDINCALLKNNKAAAAIGVFLII